MINKLKLTTLVAVCMSMVVGPLHAAETFNGGISLDKTEKLVKSSIPLPDGKPDVLLALAMRHGSARGHFSGKAAAAVHKQFKKEVPIYIEAVRQEALKNKPGCNKVRLTFKTTPQYESLAPTQSIDMEVCPNKR